MRDSGPGRRTDSARSTRVLSFKFADSDDLRQTPVFGPRDVAVPHLPCVAQRITLVVYYTLNILLMRPYHRCRQTKPVLPPYSCKKVPSTLIIGGQCRSRWACAILRRKERFILSGICSALARGV